MAVGRRRCWDGTAPSAGGWDRARCEDGGLWRRWRRGCSRLWRVVPLLEVCGMKCGWGRRRARRRRCRRRKASRRRSLWRCRSCCQRRCRRRRPCIGFQLLRKPRAMFGYAMLATPVSVHHTGISTACHRSLPMVAPARTVMHRSLFASLCAPLTPHTHTCSLLA